MRIALSATLVTLCLIIGLPTLAAAGNGTGACLFDGIAPNGLPIDIEGGKDDFAICIDALTEAECNLLCEAGVGDDGGLGVCEFIPGETCDQQDIPWDGACDDVTALGGVCALIFSQVPGESELICEKGGGGTWLGDGSVCGGVPALPKIALGVLALVLLAGTLTLLTLQHRT